MIPVRESFSQRDSSKVFLLPELTITQVQKGMKATYDFNSDKNIFYSTDSFLIANPHKTNYKVLYNDIDKKSFNNSGMKTWAAVSSAVGFGSGFIVSFIPFGAHPVEREISIWDRLKFSMGCGLAFGIAGALIGALVSKQEDYMFDNLSFDKKRQLILKALRENRK